MNRAMRAILLAAAMGGMSMNAFGFLGFGHSAGWREEVLLNDGRKIVVERHQTYGGYPTIDSHERMLLDEEWTFQNPDTRQTVTWRMNARTPPEGERLMLMILGFLKSTPYIATVPAGCVAYIHWGRPNPPYVLFKFDGKVWQRITLAEFPVEFKEANVVVGRPKPFNRSAVLEIKTILEENRDLEPHLRVLSREPVKVPQTVECPDLNSPRYTSPKAPLPMSPPSKVTDGDK